MARGAPKTRLLAAFVAVAFSAVPAFELNSVIVLPETVPTTAPTGIPAPDTDMPTAMPAALVIVIELLALVTLPIAVMPSGERP